MRNRFLIIVPILVLVLAACGGGGGGSPVITPGPAPAHLDFPLTTGDIHYAGIDQAGSQLARLPSMDERGGATIHYGTLNDGAGRETVAAYLAQAWLGVAGRFTSAPEVRVIGPSTAREREIVAASVEAINLSLPADLRMQIAPFDQETSLRHTVHSDGRFYGGHSPNVIHVEFLDCADYVKCGRAAATAWASGGQGDGARGGYLQFSRSTAAHDDDRFARIVMAHELLHVVGMDKHVSAQFDSIMRATLYQNGGTPSILTPLDREALNALYRRLEPGDDPTSFGSWASMSLHIAGNGEHANFGVALRNGYAEPWAHGPMPRTTLANNRSLSGSATWTGALLGLTPAAEAVAGDAAIIVDLLELTGSTSFVALESWAAGAAPGAAGTGTTWLDGDLDYTIAVRGNTFRETGGDDGTLTGIFTGAAHEGAAGTLERADLTAAFGASR